MSVCVAVATGEHANNNGRFQHLHNDMCVSDSFTYNMLILLSLFKISFTLSTAVQGFFSPLYNVIIVCVLLTYP